MDLKKFLLYMILGSVLSWFGFFMVLIFINPNEAGGLSFLLFYLILGFASLGTFTVLGFVIRKLFHKDELAFQHVIVSFRQAIWLSLVLVISLFLQSKQLLNWLNAILLILGLGLIEFFFLSYKSRE